MVNKPPLLEAEVAALLVGDTPTAELLRVVTVAGVSFRLMGEQIRVTGRAPRTLWPVLDALKPRKPEIMAILGAEERDRPSIELLADLGVTAVVPETAEEAQVLLAELLADSALITPPGEQRKGGSWVGTDAETGANPGVEDRPSAKLRLRDGLPWKHQPSFTGTAGLDPHRSTIRLMQLYGGGARCMVLDTRILPLDTIAEVFRDHTPIIHNASFELRFLAEAGFEVARFEDTMQATGLLLGAHRRGIDHAAKHWLGIDLPKTHQRSDWSAPVLSPGQIAYAALDAIVAFQLWRRQRVELHQKRRMPAYRLQRDVTPATVRMIQRGITFDLTAHAEQIARWEADAQAEKAAFTVATGKAPPSKPAETRAFLAEVLPADVIANWPRTPKSGELSTEGAELKRHLMVPPIRLLLSITALAKLHSTFGPELAQKVSAGTGRLHAGFNIASTKAGRFSCSDPNVQQIPKHKAAGFRACFVAEPGKVLVIADYNGMELRAAAEVYDDDAMRMDFANGVDLHRRQAAEMLSISIEQVTKDQRDAAKPICFGTIYGAGRRGIQKSAWVSYNILLTEDEAEAQRRAFLNRYPDLDAGMERSYRQSNAQGYIPVGRLGRVIEAAWESPALPDGAFNYRRESEETDNLFDILDDDDDWITRQRPWRNELKRTLCCNAPIQGACADISMQALIYVDAALRAAGIDGGVVLFVHDELVVEAPAADAERVRQILDEGMTRAFAETFPTAPIQGLVETRVAATWGERAATHIPGAGTPDRDTGASGLPDGDLPVPAIGSDTPTDDDQRGGAVGRVGVAAAVEQVGAQAAVGCLNIHSSTGAMASSALLAHTCTRCGASPCKTFGEGTAFCTLECWEAHARGIA
jgi:DNA polymerase-1